MKHYFKTILLLMAAVSLSAAIFYLCYRLDNRINHNSEQAINGVIILDMESYDEDQLIYLVKGWAYYDGVLLNADNISEYEPDEYIYIGQYGGFDRGDGNKNPHGSATYSITIYTDGTLREYALEIPAISTYWTLWINGNQMKGDGSFVSFSARDKIEIIFAVSDDSGFFSGILSAPAFGSPSQVSNKKFQSQVFHITTATIGVILMTICGAICIWRRDKGYGILALMAIVTAILLILPALNVSSDDYQKKQIVFRVSYYCLILFIVYLQGTRLKINPLFFYPAICVSIVILAMVTILPLFDYETANSLYFISDALKIYQWITAFWFLITSVMGVVKKNTDAQLVIGAVFLVALLFNLLSPYSNAIVTGGSVEIAGVIVIVLTMIQMMAENVEILRDNVILTASREVSEMQLRYAKKQEKYVEETRSMLHEHRNQLTVLWNYAKNQDYDSLSHSLSEILEKDKLDIRIYTGNSLVNAILSIAEEQAQAENIFFEISTEGIEDNLKIEDLDMASLLMNLTDNAIEANRRIGQSEERWIYLNITVIDDIFSIQITNPIAKSGEPSEKYREKEERFHGYGQSVVKRIAQKYGGSLSTESIDDNYSVSLNFC